jgi:hypothetical protein
MDRHMKRYRNTFSTSNGKIVRDKPEPFSSQENHKQDRKPKYPDVSLSQSMLFLCYYPLTT